MYFHAFRRLPAYAAIAVLSTAFFFFLHHIGNQIPLDLAKLRFADALQAEHWDDGVVQGIRGDFTYCQIAATVLADAAKEHDSLLSAVQQRTYKLDNSYCKGAEAAIAGLERDVRTLKTRYWWGSKALYAIALRFWSVPDVQDVIRTTTYIAYAALGASLLTFPPKALFVCLPLTLLGAFCSGIRYFADVENGIPYLWAVLAATVLAVLVGRSGRRWALSKIVKGYCFLAGCVSSFVWISDGHALFAMTCIGLLVYFGLGDREIAERTRFAVACVSLYVVGFGVSYALGQVVKMAVAGGDVWVNISSSVIVRLQRSVTGSHVLDVEDSLLYFYGLVAGRNPVSLIQAKDYVGVITMGTTGGVTTCLVLVALVASTTFAVIQAYTKGSFALLRDIGFVLGLMVVSVPQFVIADDGPFRSARFVFVPHALCLSCLILALWAGLRASIKPHDKKVATTSGSFLK